MLPITLTWRHGALILAFLGSYWIAFHLGQKVERSTWYAKENKRLTDTDALILKNQQDNTRIRQSDAAKSKEVSNDYEAEIAAIRAQYERNRVRRTSAGSSGIGVPGAPAAATRANAETTRAVILSEEARSDLEQLARDADEVTAKARGLQQWSSRINQ